LRRAIEHLLEDPLSEDILRGTFHGYDIIGAELVAVEGETTNEKRITFVPSKKEPVEVEPAREEVKEDKLTGASSSSN